MGNWHCIPSSCATVHYREYQGAKIRWRYPGEPWQEIYGDDYSIKQEKGKCPVLYHVFGQYIALNNPDCGYRGYWRTAVSVIGSQVVSYLPKLADDHEWVIKLTTGKNQPIRSINYNLYSTKYLANSTGQMYWNSTGCINTSNPAYGQRLDLAEIEVIRVDGQADNCGDCVFTVTKNGQIVHTETRTVCPEVQKIPCSLSTVNKQIEIKKLPYLERVEVVPYAYDVRWGILTNSSNYGLLLAKGKIPTECLNIYHNDVTSTIPTDFGNFANTPESGYRLIAQICSAPGCSPPEYQVICDCNNCESCQSGTCPVECGEQICCYGSDGISVKAIAKSNYCGGQS
jgi:hypothetical protein